MSERAILLVRLKGIGELVMLMPLVDQILECEPDAKIDMLVASPLDQLLRADPRIAKVHVLKSEKQAGGYLNRATHVYNLVRELRQNRYSLVIDFQGYFESQSLARLCRAERRVGRGSRQWSNALMHSIYPYERNSTRHYTEQMGDVLLAEGFNGSPKSPRLYVEPSAEQWAQKWIEEHGLQREQLWGLNPAAGWDSRRWPSDRFVQVGRELLSRKGGRIVVLAGPGEMGLAESVARDIGENSFTVQLTSLQNLMAIHQKLSLLVSNDTGPTHIAAALGVPVVAVYGCSKPFVSGPYRPSRFAGVHLGDQHDPDSSVPVDDQFRASLQRITPEMVLEQAEKVLGSFASEESNPQMEADERR